MKYIERNVIGEPSGVVRVLKNHWWCCVDGDPTRTLFYIGGPPHRKTNFSSPQCNSDKRVAEYINKANSMGYPEGSQLVFIPLAFVPIEKYDEY
jgi:hypothetical protein